MGLPCPVLGWRILGEHRLERYYLAVTLPDRGSEIPRWVLQVKGPFGRWLTLYSRPVTEAQAHAVLDLGHNLAEYFRDRSHDRLPKA